MTSTQNTSMVSHFYFLSLCCSIYCGLSNNDQEACHCAFLKNNWCVLFFFCNWKLIWLRCRTINHCSCLSSPWFCAVICSDSASSLPTERQRGARKKCALLAPFVILLAGFHLVHLPDDSRCADQMLTLLAIRAGNHPRPLLCTVTRLTRNTERFISILDLQPKMESVLIHDLKVNEN